jgi:predicted DNA-binding transcriptional regulator AlpA
MTKQNNPLKNLPSVEELLQPGRALRVNQIVGHILPISRSHFLAQVKAGKYPQPFKLSERVTCWKSEDIKSLLDSLSR